MKNKNENIIKRWYRLVEPNKKIWFWQIFFFMVYAVFLTLITIFVAKTINCMYQGNWKGAFIFLALELLTILIRCLAIHAQYKFYTLHVAHIRHVVARKVYNKILSCKSSSFNEISKDKITNIALNNMGYLSEFPDAVSSFLAYAIQVVITLVTVFTANYLAGIIVAILGVVNFFAFYMFNKKLGRIMLERCEKNDDIYKSYNKIIAGKKVIKELHGNITYENELLQNVDAFSGSYAKYNMVDSSKNNLYYAFWNTVVYGIAGLMLYFVSKGSLSIEIYLIIVPYLSTCTAKLNTLFDKTNSLENMRVDVDRVNLILNLSDDELIKYGEINSNAMGYNLALIDVEYKDILDEKTNNIANVNIDFNMNDINVIKGEKLSGKRSIFNILRRYIKPSSGKVVLDNLDLFDYNEKTFKSHIDYCASHPTFIPGTIKENLVLVEKDLDRVYEVCSQVGLLKYIEKLPKQLDTLISEVESNGVLFLIGLVRALLSNEKILMVYEIPEDTPETFRQEVVNYLSKNKIEKTIILFTHTNDYDEIAGNLYEVQKGKVKQIKKA